MRLACALVVMAGCWRGTSKTATPAEGTAEPTAAEIDAARTHHSTGAACNEVADHVRQIVSASTDDNLRRRADEIRDVIARRCSADAWSQELRRCLAGATGLDDTDGCEKLATQEQQDALEHDVELSENAD